MSLTKIPFILLATWGINTSFRPPNPPPPQHERFSSSESVPLDYPGFNQWGSFISRVSNHSKQKNLLNNPPIGSTIRDLRR